MTSEGMVQPPERHTHTWVEGPSGHSICELCGRNPSPFRARDDVADMARTFSLWLDSTYPADLDPEAHMRRRVTKVCEEAGEVHEAVGAMWGENPRKKRGTVEDVIKELADCAGAALGAIEHLTEHQGFSLDIVTERVREVCERVGIVIAPARGQS